MKFSLFQIKNLCVFWGRNEFIKIKIAWNKWYEKAIDKNISASKHIKLYYVLCICPVTLFSLVALTVVSLRLIDYDSIKWKKKNQSNNNNIQYQISIRHIFVMAFCCNFANFPSIFFCCISAFGLLYSGNCSGVVILAVETLLLLSGQDIKTVFVVVFEETAH